MKKGLSMDVLQCDSGSRSFGCVRIDWYPQYGERALNVLWFLGNNQVDVHKFTESNPNYAKALLVAGNCKLKDATYQLEFSGEDYSLRGAFQYCTYDFINDKWLCTDFSGEIGNGKTCS